jgi:ABC-type nitrate/sulfonate/bicarbonate transport system substrate-binding protein
MDPTPSPSWAGPANTINSLVARPDIKSFADLKGKTIGLSLPVDVISIGARQILARHGLQASDYTAKSLIGTPLRAKCLESGECAAVPLNQPEDILFATRGYHILANSHEVIPTMQFTVFAARRSWANQHKDEVVRFARAMGEAYRYMADGEISMPGVTEVIELLGDSGQLQKPLPAAGSFVDLQFLEAAGMQ